ncbi:hypothetical protein DSL72_009015 [Monilinia vaccinii-corymbosi]|uniref:Uncharacterized protein n=1 Tax=Monilinia vaccinii-corymbosi TaxID=61207 RepID=A0A8A3PPW0_9HELO|nr:hypothetical protein DSL72_009015 [Monilinia vaccinii-corymbosi]
MELAYYLFNFRADTSIHTAIVDLLLKLLKLQRHINKVKIFPKLEKHYNELEQLEISRNEPRNKRSYHERKAASEALEEAAVAIVKDFEPQQKIRIILGRVDRCIDMEQRDFVYF